MVITGPKSEHMDDQRYFGEVLSGVDPSQHAIAPEHALTPQSSFHPRTYHLTHEIF